MPMERTRSFVDGHPVYRVPLSELRLHAKTLERAKDEANIKRMTRWAEQIEIGQCPSAGTPKVTRSGLVLTHNDGDLLVLVHTQDVRRWHQKNKGRDVFPPTPHLHVTLET